MKIVKAAFLLFALVQVSACVATPRIELSESLYFDYVAPNQSPMNYGDLLCCEQCSA